MQRIAIADKLAQIHDHWNPRLIAELNGQHVRLAKILGTFTWHHHELEDELFFVVSGTLVMEFRDHAVTLNPGEMLVVPRGVEHRPVAEAEVAILMFEPAGTVNTGNRTDDPRTRGELERL